MKKVLFFILFLYGGVSAQQANPTFIQFKNNYSGTSFKPTFALSRTEYNFKLSSPQRKPVFCRMEDKLYGKFNVWLQLRAGSDQDYRKLAFPEKIDKKGSRLIE